ncbi:hypothetical protein ACIQVK_18290 [Streptomyces sp. NPDC090493]|uniref:hypothetical protein n=1 Tax=Streptomyces sp. NPDC090493 TaxID=3365964 RepID=UPI0038063F5F
MIDLLRRRNHGIVQMPCPEFTFAGPDRWWQSKEQYDTPTYREHCRELARAVVDEIGGDPSAAGTEVVVIGIDGSPSSGVGLVTSAPRWRGEPGRSDAWTVVPGRGVWIEELEAEFRARGLRPPRLVGVGMDLPGATPDSLRLDLESGLAG